MTSVTSSEVKPIIVIKKTRPSDYKMRRRGHLPGCEQMHNKYLLSVEQSIGVDCGNDLIYSLIYSFIDLFFPNDVQHKCLSLKHV